MSTRSKKKAPTWNMVRGAMVRALKAQVQAVDARVEFNAAQAKVSDLLSALAHTINGLKEPKIEGHRTR